MPGYRSIAETDLFDEERRVRDRAKVGGDVVSCPTFATSRLETHVVHVDHGIGRVRGTLSSARCGWIRLMS